MRADELFAFPASLAFFAEYFPAEIEPWEWVKRIAPALAAFDFGAAREGMAVGDFPPGVSISGSVYIHRSVRLPVRCVIEGPAWIGPEVQIRPNAYVRGNVIVGAGSVLGNSCEYKNCLLLENVETPHYNYVGDSILGNRAHLGAGAICANLKLARDEVKVRRPGGGLVPTGLRKLGALMGDGAEVTCNGVLQPGTILGPRSAVLAPSFHGTLAAGKLAVARASVGIVDRPD
jgi:NDP-sugar pyrophosphorylase family protein